MADFNALQAVINAYIKKNGVQAITGQILNGVLTGMVNALGKGFTVAGEASPSTDPGLMTGPVAYIAHTAGTYTHFDNITVDQGEVAMLIFNENTWSKNVLASLSAAATVDDQVGTPAVTTSFVNGVLTFDFRNMKGEPGINGIDGTDGVDAGFGTIDATVDANIGTPGVNVVTSGPNTAKNMTFQFTNLKGQKGDTGVTSVVVTVDNNTGTPGCTASLSGGVLTLAFTNLKGAQGDTGVSADYPITIANNLTTNDPTNALSAAMGVQLESEVTQLEAEKADKDTVRAYMMTIRAKQALLAVFNKVAFAFPDVSAEMDELENSLFNLDEIVGIEATYNQGDTIVYDQGVSTLDELGDGLVVKAVYGDGTKVAISSYTLSGDISTAGTQTITASFLGFTDTFEVEVTHYTAQMVFKISDGDIASYKGTLARYDNNTKYCITDFGTSTNRRVFLAPSGDAVLTNSSGTSIGKYPIPIPRNARKVTITVTPSATLNIGIATGLLNGTVYEYVTGKSYFTSPSDGGIVQTFSEARFDSYRKGGWYLLVLCTPDSSFSGNEPTESVVTFE